jgi:phosphopantothenoylcysteine decarboxylase/phosphopantothenate--cysteine ligase
VLTGKTVVLGVTGGIAAYKSAEIVRWLRKEGAAVVVVMTPAARRFITPLTLETLSGNPVVTSLWRPARGLELGERPPGRKGPVEHVEIADAAALVLVAPATANFLARAAAGLADDALAATLLASPAPVIVAPAMNVNMWNHPATQENLMRLLARGVAVVAPDEGELACGWEGRGRLASLEKIQAAVRAALGGAAGKTAVTVGAGAGALAGRRVLVSAGPTREAIDPVRYLSNHSSGRMGYALAEEARARGAVVTLVAGPTALAEPAGVEVVYVTTADEMQRAVDAAAGRADAVVMAAAVADYRPARAATAKLRRSEAGLELRLVPTPDILRGLRKRPGMVTVGFALETGPGLVAARRKLREKGCDLVVLNDPTRADSAFGGDTSRVTLVSAGAAERLPVLSKREVAGRIWDRVQALWARRGGGAARRGPTRQAPRRGAAGSRRGPARRPAKQGE